MRRKSNIYATFCFSLSVSLKSLQVQESLIHFVPRVFASLHLPLRATLRSFDTFQSLLLQLKSNNIWLFSRLAIWGYYKIVLKNLPNWTFSLLNLPMVKLTWVLVSLLSQWLHGICAVFQGNKLSRISVYLQCLPRSALVMKTINNRVKFLNFLLTVVIILSCFGEREIHLPAVQYPYSNSFEGFSIFGVKHRHAHDFPWDVFISHSIVISTCIRGIKTPFQLTTFTLTKSNFAR